MATFSTNQVRQLYVAEALKSPNVIATDTAGSIAVKADTAKTHLYFEYMGAGGMTRSDLIDIKNILYAKATDADDLAHDLAKYKLTLDASVNGGIPVAGQDYILRIAFRNYIGLSEEDQYFKYGMVHTVADMTASDFYKTLALSLVKNFNREEEGLLKFYLETGGADAGTVAGTPTEVTKDTKESTLTGTYTGIVIEEAPQEWVLGVKEQVPVNFTLQPGTITASGDDRIWGTVKQVASTNSIPDGHKIADLEYFCMGERGDVYRMVGFPNVIRTKYLVDPDVKYNVIDIHYAYVGPNESVQKSEKDITLVVPKVGAANSASNKLANDIITAINTATGLSIAKLSVV
nr:MAG TPA: Structural protein [Crassvirales sp.]